MRGALADGFSLGISSVVAVPMMAQSGRTVTYSTMRVMDVDLLEGFYVCRSRRVG